ncbi:hypothetical protein [Telluribacter sp.]|uniref:hypothetical protein n=1 Tax=Telluribacter sp. TaxID=1978767 RepID=UPI002E15AB7C|nr:hypothetical protein [Telluribacter sp.]
MIAFEIKGEVDSEGFVSSKQPIALRNQKVRVLALLEEENEDTEWLKALSGNSAFDFFHEEAEDIYSIEDGRKLTDEE